VDALIRPYCLGGAGYAGSLIGPHAQREGDGAPRGAPVDRRLATPAPFGERAHALRRSTPAAFPGGRSFAVLHHAAFAAQHEPKACASWDAWLSRALPAFALSAVQRAPRRAVVMPPGQFPGLPESPLARRSRGRRTPALRREAPIPAQTKAGAVLRAGPVWLLHFANASRSAPHEQVNRTIIYDRKEVKQAVF
jgi:hypothetical protein